MKKILISAIAALSISSLNAYELKPVGFKAVGMGGAGVASSRGSLATYYNPALLGISDYTSEFSLNIGVGIRENKLLDTADQLNKLNFSEDLDEISSTNYESASDTQKEVFKDMEKAIEILNKVPEGNGLEFSPSVSLATQISQYMGIGIYGSAQVRASLDLNKEKLGLIFNTSNGYIKYSNGAIDTNVDENDYNTFSLQSAVENGETAIKIDTMTLAEIPVSFAYPIEQDKGTWSFGISAKAMQVETFSKRVKIDSETDDITDDYDENKKTYTALGIDLGMLYKEKETGLTLALVGKNINSPSFETKPDSTGYVEKFEFDPFFRAGMSLPIFNDNVELAIDADLQESDTSYKGMKSRYVGGGLEFHPASWFALRAGAMKNVAAQSINEGLIYTAGFGFGLKWFQFDLSAQMSSESGTYDGEEIPKYVNLNLSLVSKWGDEYNKKQPEKLEDEVNPLDMQKTIDENKKKQIQEDSKKAHEELDKSI